MAGASLSAVLHIPLATAERKFLLISHAGRTTLSRRGERLVGCARDRRVGGPERGPACPAKAV